jgi:hypothetical protein
MLPAAKVLVEEHERLNERLDRRVEHENSVVPLDVQATDVTISPANGDPRGGSAAFGVVVIAEDQKFPPLLFDAGLPFPTEDVWQAPECGGEMKVKGVSVSCRYQRARRGNPAVTATPIAFRSSCMPAA